MGGDGHMAPSDTDLGNLKSEAEKILEGLPRDHPPVVVEFAGSPKAGKSTTIDILDHFFRRVGFKVWAPSEGASKRTPYHLKRDLVAFNTWTLNYAVSELLVAYYNVDHHNLIILDRGPYDSLAWLGVLRDRGELNKDEHKVFSDFAVHTRWADLISRVYLFQCAVEDSLGREEEAKLIRQTGTAMNPEMLSQLMKRYGQLQEDLPKDKLKPLWTSSETTPLETSYELARDLLALFRARSSVASGEKR